MAKDKSCLIISGGEYHIPDEWRAGCREAQNHVCGEEHGARTESGISGDGLCGAGDAASRKTGVKLCGHDPGYDLVIACDRGYEYAKKAGIAPDVILGDYDSAGSRPEEGAAPVILTYISDKDDTDTMLAVKYALERDITNIDICCGLGGRLDHTYGNIMSGSLAAEHGCVTRIYGSDTRIWIFRNTQVHIPRMEGWSLSCFSLSNVTRGITMKGTKFEVENVELTNATTLGNSNNWAGDTADISCREGTMMVVCSKLSDGEHI